MEDHPQPNGPEGDEVLYHVAGRVAFATLNRPGRLNALSHQGYESLTQLLDRFEADEAARVLILRGAGRSFCAGADLSGAGPVDLERTLWQRRAGIRHHAELWLRLWHCPKPVIAQVHGHCLAAGVMLATSCDLTYVAEDARIGWPKLPMGGGYISHLAAWHIGPKRAKEMSFLTGSEISGVEAVEWGMANRAFPADRLQGEVETIAHRIALLPSSMLELKKKSINSIFDFAGFPEAVLASADRDAMSHVDPALELVREKIRERGFKATIQWFEENGL